MKLLKGMLPLVVTITIVWGAEHKAKKTEDKSKKPGKRQIGYGLEAIPGLAFHAPLADEGLLIAQPTAHGGYGLVQPIGFYAPQADGFTQGFNGFPGGYGLYSPQVVAAPLVDVQPKTHQLDNGWKGIDLGHGSVRHGHEIAQSLIQNAAPYQEGVFEVAPILPFAPQFDYGRARNAMYSPNTLAPVFNGFDAAKWFSPAQFNNVQGFPKGYNFASVHGNQGIQIGPAYHHTAGHAQKGHGSISHGHQLASQGHQLAKKVHIPGIQRGFIGSHGPKLHHEKANLYSHQKHSAFGAPRQNHYGAPNHYTQPAPRVSTLEHASHDSTSHSTSYSTDVNAPQQSSYSPDINPSAGLGSSELDFSRTNGHGGHNSGEKKATSFQSFIIHSYKPQTINHKTKYDSMESDENFPSSKFNSAQALSGETNF